MAYPLATSTPLAYVGIGKQSAKGTGVTPSVFVPYRGSVSLDHGQGGDDVYEAGTGPYVNRKMKTAHDPKGSFGLGCRPATILEIAAFFMGIDDVTGASVPYTHTLSIEEVARLWVSVEQAFGDDGDIIERFVDALITGLTFSVEGNADLMAQCTWEALTSSWLSTAATPTYESGVPGISAGGPFRGSDLAYTVDGSAETNVQSFEVALSWKTDGVRLAAVTRRDLLKLEATGTVKLKQLIDDADTRDAYRKISYGSAAGTIPAASFFGTGALIVAGDNGLTSTNERELTITVPHIDWTSAKYTDLDPAGATGYLEREGTIKKVAGSGFVSIVGKSADSASYTA